MSVSFRKFKTVPMPEDEAEELASVCRGQFTADEIGNREDWSYAILHRAGPEGPLQGVLLLDTPEGEKTATIRILCAKEKGTGIPQALVAQAQRLARERKRPTLDLELLELDPKLIDVYTKMGFTADPTRSGWMTKSLKKGGTRRTIRQRRRKLSRKK